MLILFADSMKVNAEIIRMIGRFVPESNVNTLGLIT